jgi:hypothetical protein
MYLRYMRKFIILTLLLVPMLASAQKTISLKRKYLGSYVGMIPSYRVQSSEDIMFVTQSKILIKIGKNQVEMTVGGNTMFGTYEVMFEAKKYYLLDVTIDDQLATERIMVYKSGKHLSRDGMYPQPVTELEKMKKRRR